MGNQATAKAGELDRPLGRPVPERAPGAEQARGLLVSAAFMAIGGSWLVSGRSAPVPVPAEPQAPLPAPNPVPVPALEPLVPLAALDRAPLPAEDGLVALLLRRSEEAPPAAPAPAAPSSIEAMFPDQRVPEHVARKLLARLPSSAGFLEEDDDEGFRRLSFKGGRRMRVARSGMSAIYTGTGGPLAWVQEVLASKGVLGQQLSRREVEARFGRFGRVAANARQQKVWEGQANTLFSEEIIALNPDKPICRMGGSICRAPDGKIFSLTSLAQYEELEAQGLVVFPSPLVFDLDGDGVRTSDRKVRFDINGDGIVDHLSDVSSKDGLLVFDAEGDGLSGGHARELFGNETDLDRNGLPDGYPDGFAALKAFVQRARKEGVLAAESADGWLEEKDLAALERRYGLRMRVGGIRARSVPLKEAGVSRIRLSGAQPRRIKNFDGQKNDLMRQEGALFSRADGSMGVYEDVWFRAQTRRVRQTALAKAR